MSFLKKLIFLALFTFIFTLSTTFAFDICNMNGDWYVPVNGIPPVLFHFKETDGVVTGIQEGPVPCPISIAGTTLGNEFDFRLSFVGTKCPQDFYIDATTRFTPDCTLISGPGVSSNKIKSTITMLRVPITIIGPNNDKELVITAEPSMPALTFKAEQIRPLFRKEQPVPYAWEIKFTSTFPKFTVISNEIDTVDRFFTPDFRGLTYLGDKKHPWPRPVEGNIMGSQMTVSVTFYENIHEAKTYQFKGTNPGQIEIEKMITDPILRKIACQESRYRQFDAKREGGIGYPIGKVCGVGIMQLCDPAVTPEQAWDWRKNIMGGISLYNAKRSLAINWPKRELSLVNEKRKNKGLPACKSLPSFNAEQLERDIIRLYNCGHEYQWEPWDDPDCKGDWISDPPCKITNPRAYDADYINKVLFCDIDH